MSTIDFSRSRAILVGTAHYDRGLTEMPAALNSLNAMWNRLTGPLCGWPPSRITVFKNKTTRDGLTAEIAELIHDTKDVLLFYYVGHGQLLDGEHLGLALVDTLPTPYMRSSTSLRLDDVRTQLKHRCTARVKLVILDCCYSGLATRNTQGTGLADQVQIASKVEGAYTLTASRASQQAIYEDGPAGLTYFTKVFTDVVRDGIPGKGAELTLKDIHKEVSTRFLRLDFPDHQIRPEPSVLVVDTAEEFAFARNAAALTTDPPTEPDTPPEPLQPPPDDEPILKVDELARLSQSARPKDRTRAYRALINEVATGKVSPETFAGINTPTTTERRPRRQAGKARDGDFAPSERRRWPLVLRAVIEIAAGVVLAIMTWLSFTDPYRNAEPSAFEIAVGMAFGSMFAVVAIIMAIDAVVRLRKTRR
ncbi:hypothetical protein GCM10027176_37850 [Actinoallomurus bryophytorum]|uniref:Caspase domain-containing protein n=1 Tax=Actinoallomurus bryophytorum TaxID=1490222 RepID=A0A543CJ22_9ACTN|nr:caspase family protein [Actinoallomurus bryophytorum]TQL97104.1 caspase domain-containing protein [Actinoallomurus bryophytorum]